MNKLRNNGTLSVGISGRVVVQINVKLRPTDRSPETPSAGALSSCRGLPLTTFQSRGMTMRKSEELESGSALSIAGGSTTTIDLATELGTPVKIGSRGGTGSMGDPAELQSNFSGQQ